jgi:hypothetical protein
MEIIIVFVILALMATFVCVAAIWLVRGITNCLPSTTRGKSQPNTVAGASAVYDAFNAPFSDGSAELCSALTDNLLLEHYRANLGKVAGHRGDDLERFSTDLAEMLIVHMEIASRFAAMTHNKQHTRG